MAAQSKKDLSWQFYLLQLPFWSALVLLVMTTFLVIAIRFLVPQVDSLRPYLETWLNDRLPFEVEISHLSGSLFKIDPAIGIEKLTLSKNGHNFLVIEDIYFELDTLGSLFAVAPRMKDARLDGLELWLEENLQNWQLKGWEEKLEARTQDKKTEDSLRQVMGYIEQLLVQGELNFSDLRFNFAPLNDDPLFFAADSMSYRRWSEGRQFSFEVEASTEMTQPAELVITLEGEQFDPKTSKLSAWFDFPLVSLKDFQALWPSHIQEETQNMQGQFSVEGWLSLNQGLARIDLQARNVELIRDQLWQIEFESADITLEGELENWSADWKISSLRSSDYYFPQLAGRIGQNQKSGFLQLEELLLDPLTEQLKKDLNIPNAVREVITDLAPGGSLKNLLITRDSAGEFELQANLHAVKVDAWAGAPLGGGLYGWLQADTKGGQVVFADHSLQLGFPNLYTPVWGFSAAKGAVRWELEGKDLWVIGEDLAVVLPIDKTPANSVYVSGDFAYFYGPNDQRFYLSLGLLPVDVAAHKLLVPDQLVDPVLTEWLNAALLAGKVNQAGFIYAGAIGGDATFQLVTDFEATNFKFQPDWPHLSKARGRVQVVDGWVKGQVAGAKLGAGQLTNASFATALDGNGKIALGIISKIHAPLEFFPWLVKASPLNKQVPEPLHDWLYSGQIQGDVSLNIPLSEADLQPSIRLRSRISNAQLTLSQVDLAITDINGPLNFTLDKGLESVGLTGKVMSQPIKAVFHTEPESYLSFSAGIAGEDLKKRFHLPDALELKGVTKIYGGLPLAPFGVLKVISDFQGLAFTTPLPWHKEAVEKRQFIMQLDFSGEELPLSLQLEDQLDFLMHIDKPSRGSNLQLADKAVTKATLPEELGLAANIVIDKINAEAIYAWYSTFNIAESNQALVAAPTKELQGLNNLKLEIADLSWDEFKVGELNFNLLNLTEGMKFKFASAISAGEVWWPASPEQQPEMLLSHLYLPSEDKPEENKKAPKRNNKVETIDWLANYNPKLLPAAFLRIDDLRFGEKRLGQLITQLNPKEKGVSLNPLQVNLEQSLFTAQLDWLMDDKGHTSHVEGKLSGKNLEPALKALTAEKQSPLTSSSHLLIFTSDWQGSPLAFDLQKVKAKIELDLKDGHFPKTDLRLSGISQMFGLLNMDTLLRRLRLDFSDLTSKGVSYNSIKGKYFIEDGYLRTAEPTKVVSSATRMTFTGEVDLIEETLEQELIIVLPVAQSLPIAAVLVGAPQVGAAIWVVQKVFSNLFDTFTEARYKVTGPLSDPKVELQRVF